MCGTAHRADGGAVAAGGAPGTAPQQDHRHAPGATGNHPRVYRDIKRHLANGQVYLQCFGSGSMWIRIEMAPLDPDPYFGIRIRIQDSQNGVQRGK